ncbi:hypothetical protein D0C36_02300 [Mucilaginibacter conchicola]|uniref:Uncharacterized protein n=1 Tax=Mucilaginibacter conchicola TaxID=2303333 RepID=A0A372NWY4_9SPHI|nr:hypothetical protein [Mucilaginibacter conchicola]RFZ94404.1 hypothetical protein D0C36_02300 [Mucilaginibacter conchicola]
MEMVVIYGAITLHRDYIRSIDFIKSLEDHLKFPEISTSDFGLGDYNRYYHENNLMYDYSWNNMIISYACTTGAAIFDDGNLDLFILKMEHVLRNIDFAKAIVHIQSVESSENADLFWEKREHRYFDSQLDLEEQHLFETDEWNFGYGRRSLTGYLIDSEENIWHSLNEHPYPAILSEKYFRNFVDRIKQAGDDWVSMSDLEKAFLPNQIELRRIINYLGFKKTISVKTENGQKWIRVVRPDFLNIELFYK